MADGTSDKASEKYKKMLPAGMVLIKWPEDVERGEEGDAGLATAAAKEVQQASAIRLAV